MDPTANFPEAGSVLPTPPVVSTVPEEDERFPFLRRALFERDQDRWRGGDEQAERILAVSTEGRKRK
jgi:hypothetical protein